ncbi:hypothetical protein BC940DRAFT_333671 [Gongronella butleri]|nr:hypothetical protein BC940DRAFT_333671 [Gongronella butleri]
MHARHAPTLFDNQCRSLHQLTQGVVFGKAFAGVVMTDSVQLHVSFKRLYGMPKAPASLTDKDVAALQDLTGFSASGIDPGRKCCIVTAAYTPAEGDIDALDTARAVRRVTLPEYKAIVAGEKNRQQQLESQKRRPAPPSEAHTTTKELESQTPVCRTIDLATFRQHVAYKTRYAPAINNFYFERAAQDRFAAYRGKQRAIATTANILVSGARKYNESQRDMGQLRRNRRARRKKTARRRLARAAAADQRLVELQQQQQQIQAATTLAREAQQQQQRRADGLQVMRQAKRQFMGKSPVQDGVPIVAFGTGLVRKEAVRLRGLLPVGRSSVVLKHLEQRQYRGLAAVVRTDDPAREPRRLDEQGNDAYPLYATLLCNPCQRTMGRNNNATANMLAILPRRLVPTTPPTTTPRADNIAAMTTTDAPAATTTLRADNTAATTMPPARNSRRRPTPREKMAKCIKDGVKSNSILIALYKRQARVTLKISHHARHKQRITIDLDEADAGPSTTAVQPPTTPITVQPPTPTPTSLDDETPDEDLHDLIYKFDVRAVVMLDKSLAIKNIKGVHVAFFVTKMSMPLYLSGIPAFVDTLNALF